MHPPSDPVRRALRLSTVEGMLHATMVGVAESYLGALAVELGHRDRALALLATVPLLVGSCAQVLASPLASWLGSGKRLVVSGAVTQALTHVAFAAIAWTGSRNFELLLGAKILYWVSGMLIGPPWGAWMASLVSGQARERYFAWRSAAVQSALLTAFGGAGWLLWHAQSRGASPLPSLALLNAVAVGARGLSALSLALQSDPRPTERTRSYHWSRLATTAGVAEWRPTFYVVVLMFGAHTAVPFFTPYMLRVLSLDYAEYALLLAVPITTKALISPLLYRAASRAGMRHLLTGATALVALVALLWSRATSFQDLLLAQAVSGVAWGTFEYASYQLLLSSAPQTHQVEFLSMANTLIGTAQLSGALLGASLLTSGRWNYNEVFLMSAVGRALPLGLVALWVPLRAPVLRLLWRVVSVRPAGGTLQRPIVAPSEEADSDGPQAPLLRSNWRKSAKK